VGREGSHSVTNLGDPKDVSKRSKDTLRAAAERREMLRAIMGLRQGRDFINDYLGRCHINAPSFSPDALRMAFLEGERNIGLQLLADVTSAVPELYAQMLKEQGEKDDGRTLTDARDTDPGDASSDDTGVYTADYPGSTRSPASTN
jgi:hypothetical protein